MKHLDLFSGIGGFALATEMAFPDEEIEHIFCDNDPFAQAILKKHWPNSKIYDDIKTLTKKETGGGIYLLTGGFPCQPFSAAGRRRGKEDDRHLWPEMLRIIRETKPAWVLGENVAGFTTMVQYSRELPMDSQGNAIGEIGDTHFRVGRFVASEALEALEKEGYEVQAITIPAAAVGAPHRRDRIWIAAHAIRGNARRTSRQLRSTKESEGIPKRDEVGELGKPDSIPSNANSERHARLPERTSTRTRSGRQRHNAHDAYAKHQRLEGSEYKETKGHGRQPDRSRSDEGRYWKEDWPEVAARLCIVDDGLPYRMARPTGWRNAALKGAGNAIVPQIAAEILRSMIILK